jgi:hypothetical protein
MDIQEIIQRINENSQLLSDGSLSEIDRDILLDDLRRLYLVAKGAVNTNNEIVKIAPPIAAPKELIAKPHIEEPLPLLEMIIPQEEMAQFELPEPEPEAPKVQEPVITIPIAEPVKIPEPIRQPTPEPPKVAEPVREEEVKVKPSSLNEIFAGEEKSLNSRLSGGDKRPVINDHAGRKDLQSLIDFNKQYLLTNELFKGDSLAFQTAISRINEAATIEAAFEYIKTDLLPKYQWNGEMQSTRLFDKLVRQKFGI